MKNTIPALVLLFIVLVCNLAGCNYRKVPYLKESAPLVFERNGFRIVSYEGYQIGGPQTPGGKVWYVVERQGEPGVIYNCYLSAWSDEIHIYKLRAINAISQP